MKPMTDYPVAELLPHAGAMVLLDRVLSGDEEHAAAALTVRADGLFDDGAGRVPVWVGIEYLAQTIALYGGYQRLCRGLPVDLGFLLGTRRYRVNTDHFTVGSELFTHAELVLMDAEGLCVFDCRLWGEGVAVEARVNAFQPDDVDRYLRGER